MRAPFFLLLLAEDLSRGFLPLYAREMSVGAWQISTAWAVGLPIVIFMLVVAVAQPFLGGWSDRIGRRRAFLFATLLAILAHALSAQATSLVGLLAWRAGAGAAWAIGFIAAQGVVLDATDKTNRARGMATFVGIIMVSMACGPAIGGMLADGIGQRDTFLVAAALAVGAFALAWRDLPRQTSARLWSQTSLDAPGQTHVHDVHATHNVRANLATLPLIAMLQNRAFVTLLLVAAAPAKLILVAYCFYLVPLFLSEHSHSAATTGRVIMVYSIAMVLLLPIMVAKLDLRRARVGNAANLQAVTFGLALSGIAGLAILLPHALWGSVAVVALLGIAQAISISPQAALVPQFAADEIARHGESAVYGCYRFVERVGNAVGPLVAAACLGVLGHRTTFVALGMLLIACAAAFFLVHRRRFTAVSGERSPSAAAT
jgi:MFS family permease